MTWAKECSKLRLAVFSSVLMMPMQMTKLTPQSSNEVKLLGVMTRISFNHRVSTVAV